MNREEPAVLSVMYVPSLDNRHAQGAGAERRPRERTREPPRANRHSP